jgi:hypothetical protein
MYRQAGRLAAGFVLVSCLAFSFTLKMETIFSAEMLVCCDWTTRRYILGDRSLCSVQVSRYVLFGRQS